MLRLFNGTHLVVIWNIAQRAVTKKNAVSDHNIVKTI